MSTLTDQSNGFSGTMAIGTVLYHYPVLDSTNACAAKLLSQIRPKQGTIILADHQTQGRGQIGRDWHTAPGLNLCLSCILYPDLHPQEQFQVSMAVALAVLDTVAVFCDGRDIRIKWPNDIYVGDQKIAGILIQNSIQSNAITSCIAGIGLNVNETDFPTLLPNPTSLRLEKYLARNRDLPEDHQESSKLETKSGIVDAIDLYSVFDALTTYLDRRIRQIGVEATHLYAEYQNALYRRNILSRFRLPNDTEIRDGKILEVDTHGQLVIQWGNGTLGRFQHREIEYVIKG